VSAKCLTATGCGFDAFVMLISWISALVWIWLLSFSLSMMPPFADASVAACIQIDQQVAQAYERLKKGCVESREWHL
jgi:hypothetical protein